MIRIRIIIDIFVVVGEPKVLVGVGTIRIDDVVQVQQIWQRKELGDGWRFALGGVIQELPDQDRSSYSDTYSQSCSGDGGCVLVVQKIVGGQKSTGCS